MFMFAACRNLDFGSTKQIDQLLNYCLGLPWCRADALASHSSFDKWQPTFFFSRTNSETLKNCTAIFLVVETNRGIFFRTISMAAHATTNHMFLPKSRLLQQLKVNTQSYGKRKKYSIQLVGNVSILQIDVFFVKQTKN